MRNWLVQDVEKEGLAHVAALWGVKDPFRGDHYPKPTFAPVCSPRRLQFIDSKEQFTGLTIFGAVLPKVRQFSSR